VRLTSGLQFLKSRVAEWQAPRLGLHVPDVYFYALLAGVSIALLRGKRNVGWAPLLLFGGLTWLGFSATRHIPLVCIGSVPLLADALARREDHAARPAGATWRPLATLGVLTAILLTVCWRFPCEVRTRYRLAEPVKGARALATMNMPLNVFTTYNTGSYVLWAAPERLRVFVDSRADVYGDALLRQADRTGSGQDWQQVFTRWRIDAAVLERSEPLADILAGDDRWRLLAEDPDELTFVRKDLAPLAWR
jgi:hypothetical protein